MVVIVVVVVAGCCPLSVSAVVIKMNLIQSTFDWLENGTSKK